jgi:hypothetical protein
MVCWVLLSVDVKKLTYMAPFRYDERSKDRLGLGSGHS